HPRERRRAREEVDMSVPGTQVNPRLAALTEAGVSVWLDQIRRSLIESGELQRLIDEDCLRGITANPSIFEKAILGSDDYDAALSEMAHEGINVNITLLFAVEAYAKVAEAYIRGLERRLDEGKSVDVRSVASFFVSRVDTETDKRLEKLGRTDLMGTAAVANARAAYRRFQEIFDGERFARLREAGAHVQRPLWASTGTKNPAYSETKYVDELVAPRTVNTMPLPTLLAVAERSEVRGNTAELDPTEDLERLAQAGIDLDDVTAKLLRDGIAAFE